MSTILDLNDPLSVGQLFSETSQLDDGHHGMMIQDKRGYHVIHVDKNCHFLSFQEIVDLTYDCKSQLKCNPFRAAIISNELTRMSRCKSKNESKRSLLIRILLKIIQCVCNFFKGRGWITNVDLADKLSEELLL